MVQDKVVNDSPAAKAVIEMKRYDPEFDIEELGAEVEALFMELFCNYLNGNIQYIEKVCGLTALGVLKATI